MVFEQLHCEFQCIANKTIKWLLQNNCTCTVSFELLLKEHEAGHTNVGGDQKLWINYVLGPNVRLASPCGPISFDVFPIDHSITVLPMYRLCSIPAASIGQMQNSSGTVYQ